jgi:thiopeptide-type bacteriocin biosynthesis protein
MRRVAEVGATSGQLRALLAPVLAEQVDVFLSAGLAAVAADAGRRWVQVGLAPRPGAGGGEVGTVLARLVDGLIEDGTATNACYLRRSPGFQLRMESPPGQRPRLEGELFSRLSRLRSTFERPVPGVYEPESVAFGGPAAMRFVHSLFTIDSRAWLAFHRLRSPGPAWAFSLALQRRLLAGLEIADREGVEVWDRVRQRTDRTLPPGPISGRRATAVRAAWSDPERLVAGLPADVRAVLQHWGPRVQAAGRRWHAGYFARRGAGIGPWEGAAVATVLHWNRAGLSAGAQSLISDALSARP